MFPQGRHPAPHQAPGQPFKFTIPESLDRIKEEFQFLQAQYHSLKMECEKLASEKTEMQRHYVMYYEMSYGLNIEMHKQTEIAKRLNTICAQVIPFLSQEHQQQVVQAVERAKQVTMAELNAVIGVRGLPGLPPTVSSTYLITTAVPLCPSRLTLLASIPLSSVVRLASWLYQEDSVLSLPTCWEKMEVIKSPTCPGQTHTHQDPST
ncbi:Transducin-like enhancer protein 1 [Liparis tanakae]|uniref:Transducin-like enhancer protein 1 n=1 Tax=Liparis tanakae TaxID=230148 RepID=A0A4Z2GTK9_9TELE|nr:Transducin-like enhancer protein 1 [Liparis tanakae]